MLYQDRTKENEAFDSKKKEGKKLPSAEELMAQFIKEFPQHVTKKTPAENEEVKEVKELTPAEKRDADFFRMNPGLRKHLVSKDKTELKDKPLEKDTPNKNVKLPFLGKSAEKDPKKEFPWIGYVVKTYNTVALRHRPSKDPTKPYEGIKADIPKGTEVLVEAEIDGWYRVKIITGKETLTGYISSELIEYNSQDLYAFDKEIIKKGTID